MCQKKNDEMKNLRQQVNIGGHQLESRKITVIEEHIGRGNQKTTREIEILLISTNYDEVEK